MDNVKRYYAVIYGYPSYYATLTFMWYILDMAKQTASEYPEL